MLPVLSSLNTTSSLLSTINPILKIISATFPNQFSVSLPHATEWDSFYDWLISTSNPEFADIQLVVTSRLLSANSLHNISAL